MFQDPSLQLHPKEEIISVVYPSVFFLIPRLSLALVAFVSPFFFLFVFWGLGWMGMAIFGILVVSAVLYGLSLFRRQVTTMSILTTQRIVYTEYLSWRKRRQVTIPLMRIQKLRLRYTSVLGRMVRVGALVILVEERSEPIVIPHMRNPRRLALFLQELVSSLRGPSSSDISHQS